MRKKQAGGQLSELGIIRAEVKVGQGVQAYGAFELKGGLVPGENPSGAFSVRPFNQHAAVTLFLPAVQLYSAVR